MYGIYGINTGLISNYLEDYGTDIPVMALDSGEPWDTYEVYTAWGCVATGNSNCFYSLIDSPCAYGADMD